MKIFKTLRTLIVSALLVTLSVGTFRMGISSHAKEADITELPDGLLAQAGRLETDAFYYDKMGGIYIVNINTPSSYSSREDYPLLTLSFLNPSTNEVSTVTTFPHVEDYYVTGDYMYVLYFAYEMINNNNTRVPYFAKYNLYTQKTEKNIRIDDQGAYIAIGADASGHIFVSVYDYDDKRNEVRVYSDDFELLTEADSHQSISHFCGFDEKTGNFYYEGYYEYIYWGYSHDMTALKVGNYQNGTLSIPDLNLQMLYQLYYNDHYHSAEVMGNKYLVMTSTVNGAVYIYDLSKIDVAKGTAEAAFALGRRGFETSTKDSVGTRVVYLKNSDTFAIYCNGNTIIEYDLKGNEKSQFITQYPVFSLVGSGSDVYAFELNEGKYYFEKIKWAYPDSISITAESNTMQVGANQQLVCNVDTSLDVNITWTSSDNRIASPDAQGKLYAYKAGKATITATLANGVTASKEIEVVPNDRETKPLSYVGTGMSNTNNISKNNYISWSSVSYSSFYEDGSNYYIVDGAPSKVTIQQLDKSLNYKKTIQVNKELPLYGGFYSGKDYNYLVFGQKNEAESDNTEVVRVVKYTKDWVKVSKASIYGANTYIPFDAGSLRMLEQGDNLYVYTSHEMYADEGGTHHQANMIFRISISSMEVLEQQYDVTNLTTGYVSHSFNQFIQSDGKSIYRVDHSEGSGFSFNGSLLSANGIVLTRSIIGSAMTDVYVKVPLFFEKHNGNYTGATIGGFELSDSNCIIAYSYDVDMTSRNRNIYLSYTDKLLNTTKNIKITNNTASSRTEYSTPILVKAGNVFVVMWECKVNSDTIVQMVAYDGRGNQITDIYSTKAALSDCQPILCSDGNIRWYVTSNGETKIYTINPLDLEAAEFKPEFYEKNGKKYCKIDGVLQKGWFYVGEDMYYADSNGVLANGFTTVDWGKYYFDTDGKLVVGLFEHQGSKYCTYDDGRLIMSSVYFIDKESKYYLFGEDGKMIAGKGWKQVGGIWYYFDANGNLVDGWQKIGGKWYFFRYCSMMTGIVNDNNKIYCLDANGVMMTGWVEQYGSWYYFDKSGVAKTGWFNYADKWYYFNKNGIMMTDWQKIGGKWYYFGTTSGIMATGWKKISGKWYYFDDGAMVSGWQKLDGKWYYFDAGAMVSGWKKLDGKWYYFDGGAMTTGWLKLSDKWYYFKSSGAMAVNETVTVGGKSYTFDASGVWVN